MSSYQINKLRDEPIIVVTVDADFDFLVDFQEVLPEVMATLDAQSEPSYFISEIPGGLGMNYNQVIESMALVAQDENSLYHHPMVIEVLWATQDKFWQMVGEGLATDAYGNVKIKVFYTVDEALAYARAQA
jgi:ethanolamine utilization protein EutA (predicted chaperonin)